MATSQSENGDESNREVIKRGRADGTVDVVPRPDEVDDSRKTIKRGRADGSVDVVPVGSAEDEPTADNGLSVPEAVALSDYVAELRARKSLARTKARVATHGLGEPSIAELHEQSEWEDVADEYATEIARVEGRLEDGREAAVDARREALTVGDSL